MTLAAQERQRRYVERTRRLVVAAAAAFAIIITGYWFVQVVGGAEYRALAENNRLRERTVPAPRGLIFDRQGHALVENIPTYRLRLDRELSKDTTASLEFASRLLLRPIEELIDELERNAPLSPARPVLIANNLALGEVAQFEALGLEYPEFEVEVSLRRFYRHGSQTAHLLGHLGEASERQLATRADLKAGDRVGVKGVEDTYDASLRGEEGVRLEVVDIHGKLVEEQLQQAAAPGADLHLTLDLELQQEAERYFQDRVGAVVALDARSGAILAMVSSPSYNPNLFSRRLDPVQWRQLLAAPNNALQNRAIQNTYPPGSLFKIVVAVGGLEEGLIDPTDTVVCNGAARIYNHRFRCWRARGHGRVDLHEALRQSCDIYFYELARKLGIDRLAYYSRLLGLGSKTGIDIAGEKAGLVPDRQWSLRVRKNVWYPGETISVGIGQGPLLVTPLQMAVTFSTVATGGRVVRPHLLQGLVAADVHTLDLAMSTIDPIKRALWAVVNDGGTGTAARVAGLQVAGKTGTAQVVRQAEQIDSEDLPYLQRDHAWFASYAPADDPELVVVVFVEHGGHGSSAAAPLAKALYEKYFGPTIDDDLDT